MSEVNCDHCTGLACGDECDRKSHATNKDPCAQCSITGRDCAHCGPPAWEGFIPLNDVLPSPVATTERTCKRCGAPLLIKAVPRDPSKENEAAHDMVSACTNCGARDYDSAAWQGCQHNVPPWFTSGSADKPIDPAMNGYPRTEEPRPAAQDADECREPHQKHSVLFIDATPDAGYVTRILSAYIDDSYYSDNTIGMPPENPLVKQMNDWREKRNAFIREAISTLNDRRPSRPMSAEVEKAIDDKPTREQYAKWVAFYITAIDDEEARHAGCVKDGIDMLRGLYEKEVAALKEKV